MSNVDFMWPYYQVCFKSIREPARVSLDGPSSNPWPPGRKSIHPICIYLRLVARDCFAGLHTMPSSCLLPAVDLWCDGVSCWRPPAAHVPLAWRTGQLWATKGPRGVPRMKRSLRNGLGIKGAGLAFVRGGIGLLLVSWLWGVQNSLIWYIHDHIWTSSSAVVKFGRGEAGASTGFAPKLHEFCEALQAWIARFIENHFSAGHLNRGIVRT